MLGRLTLVIDHLIANQIDLNKPIKELRKHLGCPCTEEGQRLEEITPILLFFILKFLDIIVIVLLREDHADSILSAYSFTSSVIRSGQVERLFAKCFTFLVEFDWSEPVSLKHFFMFFGRYGGQNRQLHLQIIDLSQSQLLNLFIC